MYEDGLFELHGSRIKDVQVTEDTIVLKCLYNMEYAHVTFKRSGEAEGIEDIIGHTIRYITVVKDGYELSFLDRKEPAIIKGSSFSVKWK